MFSLSRLEKSKRESVELYGWLCLPDSSATDFKSSLVKYPFCFGSNAWRAHLTKEVCPAKLSLLCLLDQVTIFSKTFSAMPNLHIQYTDNFLSESTMMSFWAVSPRVQGRSSISLVVRRFMWSGFMSCSIRSIVEFDKCSVMGVLALLPPLQSNMPLVHPKPAPIGWLDASSSYDKASCFLDSSISRPMHRHLFDSKQPTTSLLVSSSFGNFLASFLDPGLGIYANPRLASPIKLKPLVRFLHSPAPQRQSCRWHLVTAWMKTGFDIRRAKFWLRYSATATENKTALVRTTLGNPSPIQHHQNENLWWVHVGKICAFCYFWILWLNFGT